LLVIEWFSLLWRWRTHEFIQEVFNGLRYVVRTGMQWRMMPKDLPPWYTVYQETQRRLKVGVFEDMVRDLRMLIREINDWTQ
jgi:transposase